MKCKPSPRAGEKASLNLCFSGLLNLITLQYSVDSLCFSQKISPLGLVGWGD